ncbi:DUF805 domain-containing protein [Pseudarthrobacter phenanthrenivorans]|uniref:DUF805 domain-containing protein n=1 Tax=Pseudarthrobacter phenanthrenivorans TaxID=361575 RepID=UPI00217D90DE|nr:DUF805 domain-containing protein [Pseudarthrobacter phenanthrenivorans]
MTIQQPADTPRTPAPGLEVPYYGAPPVEGVKRVFQKYAVFAGRASRSEYWWWFLASALASAVLNSINPAVVNGQVTGSSALGGLWFLATVVPSLAVAVRRLHDANISGWMLLLAVIPVLGWIAVLVLLAQRETPSANGSTGTLIPDMARLQRVCLTPPGSRIPQARMARLLDRPQPRRWRQVFFRCAGFFSSCNGFHHQNGAYSGRDAKRQPLGVVSMGRRDAGGLCNT